MRISNKIPVAGIINLFKARKSLPMIYYEMQTVSKSAYSELCVLRAKLCVLCAPKKVTQRTR